MRDLTDQGAAAQRILFRMTLPKSVRIPRGRRPSRFNSKQISAKMTSWPQATKIMALTNSYVLPTNRITDIFTRIRDGQAPERFTIQLLKDWGFGSTNDRAFIPLLKSLGFLSADGKPTQRYNDYRDHSRSKQVMAQALRDGYGDIFLIKENPTGADRSAIEGKFKSFHNASDNVAALMAKTFLGLLPLADLSTKTVTPAPSKEPEDPSLPRDVAPHQQMLDNRGPSLHYNTTFRFTFRLQKTLKCTTRFSNRCGST
jgi:hypothetical protein